MPVYEAIIATNSPGTALNWLRKGAGAALLAEMAAGRLAISHQALDAHPHPRPAAYLRAILVANAVLPARDEALVALEGFLTQTLAGIHREAERRLVHAYATWHVLNRLRRTAERADRPRTYTRHAQNKISTAVRFLHWLAQRQITLEQTGQAQVDQWLGGGVANYQVRDFLDWAARRGHVRRLTVPTVRHHTGRATSQDERWALLARLLHDDDLDLTDRVAGALLLLYAQQLSRITAMTTDQVTTRGEHVHVSFGRDDVLIPEPLAGLLLTLVRQRRRYQAVGSPTTNPSSAVGGHTEG